MLCPSDFLLHAPLRCARAFGREEGFLSFAYPAFTPRFAMLASATYRAIINRPAEAGLGFGSRCALAGLTRHLAGAAPHLLKAISELVYPMGISFTGAEAQTFLSP